MKAIMYNNMQEYARSIEAYFKNDLMIRYIEEDNQVFEVYGHEFFAYVKQVANTLAKLPVKGNHIGIMGKNTWKWLACYLGIVSAGGVVVTIESGILEEDLCDCIKTADVELIIYDETSEIEAYGQRNHFMSMKTFEESTESCQDFPDINLAPEDDGCIFFTSGTTGKAKAVLLSQKAMVASFCNNILKVPVEANLEIAPFHHLFGFCAPFYMFAHGGIVCLGLEFKYIFDYLSIMKPDYISVVPAVIEVIGRRIKNATIHGESLGWNLKALNCGAASFPQKVLDQFKDKDIHVCQSYGLSECGGIGLHQEMTLENIASIGKASEEIEVKLLDGELMLRCDSMMTGYYNNPEETAKTIEDGWLHTGDLAYIDEEGYIYLTGRKKNLITLSNGENVSPERIEGKLRKRNAGLEEVLVCAYKNALQVKIYAPTLTDEEIDAIVEEYNLEAMAYEQIGYIDINAEPLPKTSLGKIIRG